MLTTRTHTSLKVSVIIRMMMMMMIYVIIPSLYLLAHIHVLLRARIYFLMIYH